MLQEKWPEKYNLAGYLSWTGRLYGKGLVSALGQVSRVYHGTWGSASFQSLYQTGPNAVLSALLMPEWHLIVLACGLLAALGWNYGPLRIALPVFIVAAAAPVAQAWRSARRAAVPGPPRYEARRLVLRLVTTLLYIVQPIARLAGRMSYGLSPWRRHGCGFRTPRRMNDQVWSETWREPWQWMEAVEKTLRAAGLPVLRGGDFDSWDLEICGGMLGSCRLQMAVEEHGAGRQLARFQSWPRFAPSVLGLMVLLAACTAGAGLSHAYVAFVFLAAATTLLGARTLQQSGAAMAETDRAVRHLGTGTQPAAQHEPLAAPMLPQLERLP
jgi:hypothetical protein